MHILAIIILHQYKVCVFKGKRKLKLLLISCENFVLFAQFLFCLAQFLFCFANIILENVEKKFKSRGMGVREGRSGYITHFFRLNELYLRS